MTSTQLTVDAELDKLQRETFGYFLHETNPANGLVIDKTAAGWLASIAATGLGLACYPVAIERGFMSRAAAVERTLTTLRLFWNSPQGPEPDATGYKGFYYHFLDMQTGRRASGPDDQVQFVRLQSVVQSHPPGNPRQPIWLVGLAVAFRAQSGTNRADDRKLSDRMVVTVDAQLSVHRRRLAPGGFSRGLADFLTRSDGAALRVARGGRLAAAGLRIAAESPRRPFSVRRRASERRRAGRGE